MSEPELDLYTPAGRISAEKVVQLLENVAECHRTIGKLRRQAVGLQTEADRLTIEVQLLLKEVRSLRHEKSTA